MKLGLEILYAKPDGKEGFHTAWTRDLAKELRERHWIRAAAVARPEASLGEVGIGISFPLTRESLGRTRDEPGDGFRYVFRTGTSGTGAGVEWIEVTEVFEGVKPQDIESFMRLENGGDANQFDREAFLSNLRMGLPRRVQQRRAADAVLAAIEHKLSKPSYEDLGSTYGYGTLMVGLPLWFASDPLNPLRPENALDDFMSRVRLGLDSQKNRLRKPTCPFWRIVVAWNPSMESLREWRAKARLDIYEDPATYRKLGTTGVRGSPRLRELGSELEGGAANDWIGEAAPSSVTLSVQLAQPRKRNCPVAVVVPAADGNSIKLIDKGSARYGREGRSFGARVRFGMWLLGVLRSVRVNGFVGLGRWVAARVSLAHGLARFALRRRFRRLYRESRKGGHQQSSHVRQSPRRKIVPGSAGHSPVVRQARQAGGRG